MRILTILFCLVAGAAGAAAQTVEIGGRIAAGCVGSDGSMCGGGTSPLVGAHASLWAGDRIELSAAFARVKLSSFNYQVFDPPVDVVVTDRSRDFVSMLFVYHFLKGQPVRPMLGLGSGWYADARSVTCRPGCIAGAIQTEQTEDGGTLVHRAPALGRFREWDPDVVFVVGLTGIVHERWVVRGGWQSHRFANDENSTQEFFTGLGYRFGFR